MPLALVLVVIQIAGLTILSPDSEQGGLQAKARPDVRGASQQLEQIPAIGQSAR